MADLLLELFSEEIPARMQKDAALHLQSTLEKALGAKATTFVTPRRLAIIIEHLPASQPSSETEVKGPKVGAPEAALAGFLKKNNLTQSDLTERDGVYFAVVKKEGAQTADILKSAIEDLLKSFPWPKSMRWGNGETAWVRPLHSILCIFDGKIVPVEFAGITAGNTTHGHRFLSSGTITITDPAQYEAALEKAFVIADREKRKAIILAQAEKIAANLGLKLKKDDGLLEEVTGLVEWPVLLAGAIDAKYMDLPKEVLVSEMRAHQKYFALENADGTLSDRFLITSNMVAADQGLAIIAGNERVLRARLSDGRFFWDQDRKKPLEGWAEGLKTVTYHAKLGTIADKVERIKKLAVQLAEHVPGADKKSVERAVMLCKADLTTGMVGEFPELQGVMGRYYALAQSEKPEIADAIRDHYKPQGPSDSVPAQAVAICVALADKLDTLISMFAIGEKPTGSKDPFALRRAALGIIRIILENGIRLPLSSIIPDAAKDEIIAFLTDRLKVQLKDSGIRHDVINAVVANGDDDLIRIVKKSKELQELLSSNIGQDVLAAYKRANNILMLEEKKDGRKYNAPTEFTLLSLPEEKNLYAVIENLSSTMDMALKIESFRDAMEMVASTRPAITAFFDNVMVNDSDQNIRQNRLNLLSGFCGLLNKIANFSLIEGETKGTEESRMMYHYEDVYPMGPVASITAFFLYFLPTMVAFYRRHHNRMAIFILNFFLGWSGLGWVIALIWSFTMVQKNR